MRTKFLLLLIGLLLLVIPSQAQETTFGDVIFALDISLQGTEPITPLSVFPNGLPVIVALVDIENLDVGTTITVQWLLNGNLETAFAYTHESTQTSFRLWTPLINVNGIASGSWTVRILLNGDLVQTGAFEITAAPFVFPIQFGTACGRFTNELYGDTTEYEAGAQSIYALIRYANFPQSTPIAGVWSHNGDILEGEGLPVETTLTGNGQRCFHIGDAR
ncbi:MAG: hypothetical protein Q9P01_09550 [Anaerolineae bacterium]|nr:hypothetical protein [Anaerolineae bacterium]